MSHSVVVDLLELAGLIQSLEYRTSNPALSAPEFTIVRCMAVSHYTRPHVHHAQAHQGVERPGSLALALPNRLRLKPLLLAA
jgi:hypothetical protein